ncbi:MAG TPA: DUF4301 family protein [bacterium]|nr:DUF4301 family protein [bacterium]
MTAADFSPQDLAQIASHGLSVEAVGRQLERFARGPVYADLVRPCRIGDGIRRVSEAEARNFRSSYGQAVAAGRAMKFVPASGAGTRMFQKFLQGWHGKVSDELAAELSRLGDYPFYPALREKMDQAGRSLEDSLKKRDFETVLDFLLGPRGLAYADSPKGLVQFHRYPEGSRSALEEQVAEAAELTRDSKGRARIHFTVAEKHRRETREHLAGIIDRYAAGGVQIELGDSLQAASTDTIAADESNRPFRDRQGRLVFRPAGHGALLGNLQNLGGDIVFLKNIDNVAPARWREARLDWERVLGGVLAERQRDPYDRPLRVVGVVPNQGEPGGAPFWVRDARGNTSLQIVESAQVDPNSAEQQAVFRSSTHFNPVILACGLRDSQGQPFDLAAFADPEAGFISTKSYEGRPLKALELPGLWNGSMAYWETIFVEIPIETFSPVKTVEDLLRPEHRTV